MLESKIQFIADGIQAEIQLQNIASDYIANNNINNSNTVDARRCNVGSN